LSVAKPNGINGSVGETFAASILSRLENVIGHPFITSIHQLGAERRIPMVAIPHFRHDTVCSSWARADIERFIFGEAHDHILRLRFD